MQTIDLAHQKFLMPLTNVIIKCKTSPQTTDKTCIQTCTSKKDFQSLTSFSSYGGASDPKRVIDRSSHPSPQCSQQSFQMGQTRDAVTLTRPWHERSVFTGHHQAWKRHPPLICKDESLSALIDYHNRTDLDCTKHLTKPVLLLLLMSIIAGKQDCISCQV